MRILWIYEALSPQHVEVAEHLRRRADVHLDILTRSDLPLEQAHLKTGHIACHSKIDFRARSKIRRQIKIGNYDVVHAYTSRNFANALGACNGLRGAPPIIGYRGIIDRPSKLDPANWITFFHPRAAGITCVCEATRAALIQSGVPERKTMTIWEGCNPSVLQAQESTGLSEYGIPDSAFVIGTVATIRPVKGVDLMMRAALELESELNIYWALVGPGHDNLVKQLASDPRIAGRVKLLGSIPKGGRMTQHFDVYVAPSRKEGLSMSIMEAMTQKTCPVVTNVGGNAELIRDGIDGIVVPPEDPSAIAKAISQLYHDPAMRNRFADSAYRRANDVFSIPKWAERLLAGYQSTLSIKRRQAA